ncbi:MAG: hypothetical protein PHO03_04575 [Candidatus Omnitrophica bacterium]|nr:hypothetical protein [Candidatus Omnitrophota bacterium]
MLEKKILQNSYYDKKLSMVDTAKLLNVTPATVAYWMKRHGFKRRSISESVYVKQNPSGNPFNIKTQLTERDRELFISGLMLYWAEGSRRNKHVIQLANLDHRMLSLFIEFLRKICGVKEEKLTLNIQLYRKFNRETTKNYWSRALGIPKRFIAVNIHSDIRSKFKNQWSKYGIVRIEVRNVKLKQWIDVALEKYLCEWV